MATAPQSLLSLPEISPAVADWVESVRKLTTPDKVQWCDGSPAELERLKQTLEKSGELKKLNQTTFPGCHIAYSHPSEELCFTTAAQVRYPICVHPCLSVVEFHGYFFRSSK